MPLRRLVRVGLSCLLLTGGATGMIATGAEQAGASTSDGTLTVETLRDFFGTGVINTTMDVPQRGMKVTVTDAAGHHVSGVTDATGKVVVAPSASLTGGRYRVDVTVPAPYSGYLRAARLDGGEPLRQLHHVRGRLGRQERLGDHRRLEPG